MSGPASVVEGAAAAPDWVSLAGNASRSEETEQAVVLDLLVLQLGDESYAVPVERVREIVRLRPITPVPRVPKAVLGAVALRGEVVQVVDLRVRLALEERESTRESRLIILHGDDDRVAALLVDSVCDVLRVPEESLRPAEGAADGCVSELALRGAEFVSILDIERILDLDAE
jgi:purine-binding chemotaxis protein CheW